MSVYSVPVGNSGWGSGFDLHPVTEAEAVAWLEEKGLTEALETHFGDRVEDA